jgi:D-3-phosphoglycerate dehydrogenase
MPRILLIDKVHPLIHEALTSRGFICDHFPGYGRKDFESIAGQYTAIIIRSGIILDRDFLEKAPNLKFIGRVGAGMENIDVEYAEGRGIACLNSPEGNRDAVGEHALGLLLSLMNHLNRADLQVRQGQWIREGNRGTEIKGKTVAIIGYGNMGGAFARRLAGFEATVIAYDKYRTGYSDQFAREATMQEVFDSADIVSLHVPLTDETRLLVCDSWLASFRKNIFLVNTARGAVVGTKDLVKGIQSGKVRGAALDVLEYEDRSYESLREDLPEEFRYLLGSDRVVLSPHIAGWTVESNIRLAQVLVDKIFSLSFAAPNDDHL